jgi:multimeric flavodoxin WrbA
VQTVLGISASSRAWGNCEVAVKAALVAAHEEGAQTSFIRLPDLAIEQCRGCFKCLSDEAKCPLGDDLAGLLEDVDAAGGLVLASPVYFGLPPGGMVCLLDRLLVRTPREGSELAEKRAVTITIMGNGKWRGLAEPVANMIVGLLGFDLSESLRFVAEGPGEVLSRPGSEDMLRLAGKLLAADGPEVGAPDAANRSVTASEGSLPARCPICRADFFRIDRDVLECPVCGAKGDLAVYLRDGGFERVECEPRWGRPWLKSHVASWIRPSIERYKPKRREVLRKVARLKRRYSDMEKGE